MTLFPETGQWLLISVPLLVVHYCSFSCWLFLVRPNRNFCGSEGMSGSPSPGDLHPQNSCSVRWSLTLCNPEIPGTDHTDRNTSIICLERVMHPVIWRMKLSLQTSEHILLLYLSLSSMFFSCYISLPNSFITLCSHSLILSTPFFVSTFFCFC